MGVIVLTNMVANYSSASRASNYMGEIWLDVTEQQRIAVMS